MIRLPLGVYFGANLGNARLFLFREGGTRVVFLSVLVALDRNLLGGGSFSREHFCDSTELLAWSRMNRARERLRRSSSLVPENRTTSHIPSIIALDVDGVVCGYSIQVVPNARLYIVSGLHLGMPPALLGTPSSSFLGEVHLSTEWALSLATVWSILLHFVGGVPSPRLYGSDGVDTMRVESGTNKERLI